MNPILKLPIDVELCHKAEEHSQQLLQPSLPDTMFDGPARQNLYCERH